MAALGLALLASLAAALGGMLPVYTRVREIGTRYLLGFAAGVMVSVGLVVMLPQMAKQEGASFIALAIGFFALYATEKMVTIHSCREGECEVHGARWTTLIGIATESLLDGIAIAVGYSLAPAVGLTIAFAVMAHEFPRGFTTTAIFQASGYSRWKVLGALSIDVLLTPVGVGLVLLGLFPDGFFGPLLAFTAGTFIYIGASDLLPEAHRHWNIWVVVSVIAGALLIPMLEIVTGV